MSSWVISGVSRGLGVSRHLILFLGQDWSLMQIVVRVSSPASSSSRWRWTRKLGLLLELSVRRRLFQIRLIGLPCLILMVLNLKWKIQLALVVIFRIWEMLEMYNDSISQFTNKYWWWTSGMMMLDLDEISLYCFWIWYQAVISVTRLLVSPTSNYTVNTIRAIPTH